MPAGTRVFPSRVAARNTNLNKWRAATQRFARSSHSTSQACRGGFRKIRCVGGRQSLGHFTRPWTQVGRALRAPVRHYSATTLDALNPAGFGQQTVAEAGQVVTRSLDSVAQQVAYTGLWGAIRTFPQRRPFLTNLAISVGCYTLADYVVQRKSGKVDQGRLLNFAMVGLVQGCVSWSFYVNIFSRVVPHSIRFANLPLAEKIRDRKGQMDVLRQVCLDNFLYTPFVFFPIFYSCKAAMQEPTVDPSDLLQRGLSNYQQNLVEDNVVSWRMWMCGDLAIFAVPAWMRMPLFQTVSFAYTMVLSSMRGGTA